MVYARVWCHVGPGWVHRTPWVGLFLVLRRPQVGSIYVGPRLGLSRGPRLGLSILALGWVYLCWHSGLSTLYWPHLPRTLAYVGPMVAEVSLFWPYLPLMSAHVAPIIVHVGAMRPQVGSIYVGPRLGLSMLSRRSVNPILAPSPPYVGLCWPYGSLCEPILALYRMTHIGKEDHD